MTSTSIAVTILLVSFVVLIMLRFPIALTLVISSLLTIMFLDIPLPIIGQQMIQGMNSFSLLAIPFFILTGQIMSTGGLATRIVNLAILISRTNSWRFGHGKQRSFAYFLVIFLALL